MPRARGQRKWIKLYPVECLEGSIRYQLESDERGVWYDLLNFAALCSEPGIISDRDNRAYPHSFIANRLNVSLELFERSLEKCLDEGRVKENDNGITIVNWPVYQSEYDRQKPYRQGIKGGKSKKKSVTCSCGRMFLVNIVEGEKEEPIVCPSCGKEIRE